MDSATAQQAAQLVSQIDALTSLLAKIAQAKTEAWTASVITIRAPDEGSASAAGTFVQLLPFRDADADISALVIETARQTYQTQLDALNAQLSAL